MKILFLNGFRGEWGYIRPIIDLCIKEKLEYQICATNTVVLPNYGNLVGEIKAQGYNVTDELFMAMDGYNHYTMAKSLGVLLSSFVDVLYRTKPSWVVLAGDRGEQFMGAVAASYTYTPIAHIQAGERSGNIDGVARHSITKLAHMHFAANEDAQERLIKLGEEPFRVHNVGAPQLDELVHGRVSTKKQLENKFNFDFSNPYLMVVHHPVTEEFDQLAHQAEQLGKAINSIRMRKVWIMPNNDAGTLHIREKCLKSRTDETIVFENLSREDYLGFMKNCAAMVGNSSSGILEAPTFKIPAVNIGRRQRDRLQGANVINVDFETKDIVKAIEKAISPGFHASLKNSKNPYGDGNSAERILEILKSTPINDKLLIKNMMY